ncbi:hypothetical protein Zm00014a_037942 [Zea mays]|jgi:hypothetical protein|uniref:Uncharacterized protein n=1 Tax=Zea mays TaxID=4577 RepID=A0A3L6DAF5_MAIZE|nr:hypothetical protein Zm00014a_037942 [Zea mays]
MSAGERTHRHRTARATTGRGPHAAGDRTHRASHSQRVQPSTSPSAVAPSPSPPHPLCRCAVPIPPTRCATATLANLHP